jgi:CBS domain-containing protein
MSKYDASVEVYMSQPVHGIEATTALVEVEPMLRAHRISSLAVTESGKPVGVVSRTDLLRVGRRGAGRSPKSALLHMPDGAKVRDAMTQAITTIAPGATIAEAARLMVDKGLHRVYVADRSRLIGVLSTKDVMRSLAEARDARPISEMMTSPVLTVQATDPVALAVERLAGSKISGVVVTDEDWPVGVFTRVESLAAKDAPRDQLVEESMNPSMLCMDVQTPLFRAAAQASATRARRVIAVEDRKMRGVLTGIDFARAAL